NPSAQRFSFRLLHVGRLSRPARLGGADLAHRADGPGAYRGVPRQGGAPSGLLCPVLACARHHLGRAVHRGLSDGSTPMTMNYDRAPGEEAASPETEEGQQVGVLVYTIGLGLAVILTATSFWVANTSVLWGPGVHLGLAVLAIAQMGVHLVFFLHITTGP